MNCVRICAKKSLKCTRVQAIDDASNKWCMNIIYGSALVVEKFTSRKSFQKKKKKKFIIVIISTHSALLNCSFSVPILKMINDTKLIQLGDVTRGRRTRFRCNLLLSIMNRRKNFLCFSPSSFAERGDFLQSLKFNWNNLREISKSINEELVNDIAIIETRTINTQTLAQS